MSHEQKNSQITLVGLDLAKACGLKFHRQNPQNEHGNSVQERHAKNLAKTCHHFCGRVLSKNESLAFKELFLLFFIASSDSSMERCEKGKQYKR